MDTALQGGARGLRAGGRLDIPAGKAAGGPGAAFMPARVPAAPDPAETRAEAAAAGPFHLPSASGRDEPVDRPPAAPAPETAAQLIARRAFAANLRALDAVDRMRKSLLDILA